MSQRDAHESYAVAAGRLHWLAAILAGTLTAIIVAMYLLARTVLFASTQPAPAPLPPAPRLQSNPQADLAADRARERALLGAYGWVDRDAGIARIPVDRAMQLLLEQQSSQAAPGRAP